MIATGADVVMLDSIEANELASADGASASAGPERGRERSVCSRRAEALRKVTRARMPSSVSEETRSVYVSRKLISLARVTRSACTIT
jgi:hypothetical protein